MQETCGYFICLEDRALLCRKCDTSIHTVNSYVRSHKRFLLGGIRVGLGTSTTGLNDDDHNKNSSSSSAKEKLMINSKASKSKITSNIGAAAAAEDHSSIRSNANKIVYHDDHQKIIDHTTPIDSRIDWRFKDILELIESPPNNPSSQELGLSKVIHLPHISSLVTRYFLPLEFMF